MCATPVPEQCPQREKAEQRYKNPKLKNHFYGDVGVNGFTNWPSDPEWNDFAYVITRNEVHLQFFTVAADGTLKQRFAKAWQVTITNRFNPGAPVTYNIGHEVESDPTGTITDARPSQTQPNHHVWNVSDGRNLFQIIVHQ
jgi:hypothetical protein